MLITILNFILIGLGVAFLARKVVPHVVPVWTLKLSLLGMAGGFAGGLLGLVLLGYARADENTGALLLAYWLSPFFALAGALLVLAAHRLVRSRLMIR